MVLVESGHDLKLERPVAMMEEVKKVSLGPEATIREALAAINRGNIQFALVVDESERLLGCVTDGDIRRGLLRGLTLEDSVIEVCHRNPITASIHDDREKIDRLMVCHGLFQIPMLDNQNRVVRIWSIADMSRTKQHENVVVLMAGGLGERLRPLTEGTPKPLLKVGNRPILETILEHCLKNGFYKFMISVRYRAEQVKDYFGDGSTWGAQIEYLHEDQPRGTIGALGMLKEKPNRPLLIMNGDLLTKVNLFNLLSYHEQEGCAATICVREIRLDIPYGVVRTEGQRVVDLEEKPSHRFLINAGIYVLTPPCLDRIPENGRLDMPDLLNELLRIGLPVATFPVHEYWLDIGRLHDFEQANDDYGRVFQNCDD